MDLHWFPVHQRGTLKILILTYQDPQYLCDFIVPYVNTNLRSSNMLLIAPCRAGNWWKITNCNRTTVHYGGQPQTVVNNCNPQFTRHTKNRRKPNRTISGAIIITNGL